MKRSGQLKLLTGVLLGITTICMTVINQNKPDIMENAQSDTTTLFITWTPNPEEQEAMQEYVQGVMPKMLALGVEIIKRSKITDSYHGQADQPFFAVANVPSKKALVEFFDSETYQAYVPLRNKGFTSISILFAEDL